MFWTIVMILDIVIFISLMVFVVWVLLWPR